MIVSSSARENIATRTLIAISLLCLVVGSGMIYIGLASSESLREQRSAEMLKAKGLESPEFRDCLSAATRNDVSAQVSNCYVRHGPDLDFVQVLQDGRNAAERMVSRGLALVVLPVPLSIAFFILRWILTGRWTRFASQNTESNQGVNSG